MVTVGMNYRVRSGQEAAFEAAFERMRQLLEQAEGHDASRLYRSADAGPAEYLIVSRWSDEAAYRAFLESEPFRKVTRWGLAHILEGRPTHTVYREG